MTPPKTCPKCRLLIECCDCGPSAADTAAEQAFWDACVASAAGGNGSPYSTDFRVKLACDVADALVIERRKRIAARAKGS